MTDMNDPSRESLPPAMQRFEDWLDGRLDDADAAQFKAEAADDVTLQQQLELHAAIVRSLRQAFDHEVTTSLPGAAALSLNSVGTRTDASHRSSMDKGAPTQRRTLPRQLALAAAAVLMLGVTAWMVWPMIAPAPGVQATAPRTLDAVFASHAARDFKPAWVCADDEEFAQTFRRDYGQALLMKPSPEGTGMIGLIYDHAISAYTALMLCYLNDNQHAIVFIDRRGNDRTLEVDPASGLHLYRREVGDLVLYELTPLSQPTFLELMYNPDEAKPA